MDNSLRIIQKTLIPTGAAALIVGLSACTAPDPSTTSAPSPTASSTGSASGSPAPTASVTPAPSPSEQATIDAEQAARNAEVKAWADTVLPTGTSETLYGSFQGYNDEGATQATGLDITYLEPGGYSVYVICRGDGSVNFTAISGDTEVMKVGGECNEQVQGLDVGTGATGINFTATPTGEVEYALAITDRLPG